MAKRAKTSTGDEPPAGSSNVPETSVISPELSPRRSPRHSPQRKFITYFSLTGGEASILATNILGRAGGEEQHQGGSLKDAPVVPSPSTTPPLSASPARAPADELILAEEEPASMGTGNLPPATNVAGSSEATPQQLDAGNCLLRSTHHSLVYLSLSFFCLLELRS
jgi:hypothetical protein